MGRDVEVGVQIDSDAQMRGFMEMARGLASLRTEAAAVGTTSRTHAAATQTAWSNAWQGIQRAGKPVLDMFRSMGQALTQLVHVGGRVGAVVGVGLAALVGWGLQVNSQLDLATRTMAQFVGGTAAAKRVMADITGLAAKTPFELPGLARGGAFLAAMGLKTQGGVAAWTRRAATLAAASGQISDEGVMEAARGIGYLRSGRRGEATESLTRMGISPEVWKQYGAKFKMTGAGMQWESSADEMIRILARIIDERYGNILEEQSKTWAGQMSTFKDNVRLSLGALQEGVYSGLVALLTKINGAFDKFKESGGFQKLKGWIDDLVRTWGKVAEGKVDQAIKWLTSDEFPAAMKRFGEGVRSFWTEDVQPIIGEVRKIWGELGGGKGVAKLIHEVAEAILWLVGGLLRIRHLVPGGAETLIKLGLASKAVGGANALALGVGLAALMRSGGGGAATSAVEAATVASGAGGRLGWLAARIGAAGGAARGAMQSWWYGRRSSPIEWVPNVRGVDTLSEYESLTRMDSMRRAEGRALQRIGPRSYEAEPAVLGYRAVPAARGGWLRGLLGRMLGLGGAARIGGAGLVGTLEMEDWARKGGGFWDYPFAAGRPRPGLVGEEVVDLNAPLGLLGKAQALFGGTLSVARERARLQAISQRGLAQEVWRQQMLGQGYGYGDIESALYGPPPAAESRRERAMWAISPAGLDGGAQGYARQVNIVLYVNGVNDLWPKLQEALAETGAFSQ